MVLQKRLCLLYSIGSISANSAQSLGVPLALKICVSRNANHYEVQNDCKTDQDAKRSSKLFGSMESWIREIRFRKHLVRLSPFWCIRSQDGLPFLSASSPGSVYPSRVRICGSLLLAIQIAVSRSLHRTCLCELMTIHE